MTTTQKENVWRGLFTAIGVVMLSTVSAHYTGWPGPVGVIGAYLIWRVNY